MDVYVLFFIIFINPAIIFASNKESRHSTESPLIFPNAQIHCSTNWLFVDEEMIWIKEEIAPHSNITLISSEEPEATFVRAQEASNWIEASELFNNLTRVGTAPISTAILAGGLFAFWKI